MDRALNITVCILTFRRPDGLAKLLETLLRQLHEPSRPYALTVLVVDNDAAGSAGAIVDRYRDSSAYELVYVVEPRQGIPLARNRALDSAPAGTDLVVFIDDDEWPVDTWIDPS